MESLIFIKTISEGFLKMQSLIFQRGGEGTKRGLKCSIMGCGDGKKKLSTEVI